MIKRLTAWHALPGVEPAEALRYWRVSHATHVKNVPGIARYVHNHCTTGPMGDANAVRPYDGLGEVWFEGVGAAEAALAAVEWNRVLEDAATFMDLNRITAVWAEEHVI
jgi:uncharacterized protein (TIGR02118 family)